MGEDTSHDPQGTVSSDASDSSVFKLPLSSTDQHSMERDNDDADILSIFADTSLDDVLDSDSSNGE